jgi:hypothetical protein
MRGRTTYGRSTGALIPTPMHPVWPRLKHFCADIFLVSSLGELEYLFLRALLIILQLTRCPSRLSVQEDISPSHRWKYIQYHEVDETSEHSSMYLKFLASFCSVILVLTIRTIRT